VCALCPGWLLNLDASRPWHWGVNFRERTVVVYWEPGNGEYRQRRTRSEDDTVTPQFEEAPSFDVEALLPGES